MAEEVVQWSQHPQPARSYGLNVCPLKPGHWNLLVAVVVLRGTALMNGLMLLSGKWLVIIGVGSWGKWEVWPSCTYSGMFIHSFSLSHSLYEMPSVMLWCSKKTLNRCSPLTLDFPASRTMSQINSIAYNWPRLWYSVTATENELKQTIEQKERRTEVTGKLDLFRLMTGISSPASPILKKRQKSPGGGGGEYHHYKY